MRQLTAGLAILMLISAASAGDPPIASGLNKQDYYARIEVKGNLVIASDYKFDPNPDLKSGKGSGASIRIANSWGGAYWLVFADKKQYDFAKAYSGKRVIVSGELETVLILPPFGAADQHTTTRQFIRLRDIRLAEPK